MSWIWDALGIALIPALVGMNGFFVAAEFSLVAVRKTRIEELIARGVKGAAAVHTVLEHLDRAIAATQLGITISSLALGLAAETSLAHGFTALFSNLPEPWDFLARHSVASALAFILVTFLHVVFGELFPKTIALQTPDRVALWVARPLLLFERLTRPLIAIMNGTGNFVARLFGFDPQPEAMVHSVEELLLLIEDTEEAGIIDAEQAKLLENVFLLTQKAVRDCMVPREKMDTLELNMSPANILEKVRGCGHTRMPVYEGEFDNMVGIVNTKDLFFLFSLSGVVVLEDAIYPALFLKPDEEVANAMRLFKKAKRHMALVRDESGKIMGVITLEDILEEIIGDIEDEQDQPKRRKAILKLRRRKPPGKK